LFAVFGQARDLFGIADYRRIWAVGGLSGVARWLEFVALAIFAYELTQSPALVALLAVLRMLPYTLCGVLTGALADAFDRRMLLTASAAAMALTASAMAVLTATGHAGYPLVAAATMLAGAFWTVDMPVRRRLLVDAAGPGKIAAALGFDNSTMYATRAIGPLVGGVAYQLVGITGIYVLIAAGYFVCFWLATRTSREDDMPLQVSAPASFSLLSPPWELIRNRRFQVFLGVTLVYNLWCFPFSTMVPVIAQRDFALTPALVGAMAACEGLGGMLGAIAVGILATERVLFRLYYFGTLALLVLMFGLSLHLTVPTAVAVLLVMGLAAACFSATQYGLVYVMAPPEMRGRATGILSLFIGSSMLGHYHAGILFERLGSASAMTIMATEGAAMMLILAVLWFRSRGSETP
jgi:predicted MFS family arabinose efflux permease